MTTECVERKSSPVDWTIQAELNSRKDIRNSWDQSFKENYLTVADRISHSITSKVFSQLRQRLSNPYRELPIASKPLSLSFSLEIGRRDSNIKELAQDAVLLSPLREWLQKFDKEKSQDHQEIGGFSKFSRQEEAFDTTYFQNQMSKIGHAVQKTVQAALANFISEPQNHNLKYKVEWHRQSEKYLGSWDSRDNYLSVNLWIE